MKKFDVITCVGMVLLLNVISVNEVDTIQGFTPYHFGWLVGAMSIFILSVIIVSIISNKKNEPDIVDIARDAFPIGTVDPTLSELICHLEISGEFSMELLMRGTWIKRKHWDGYWAFYDEDIHMHCADGSIIKFKETDDVYFTVSNMLARDWELATEKNTTVKL